MVTKYTSEWVSLGHPDKIADYISEHILDKYIEYDPNTRYAVEVQIKDNFVSIAGEVTSNAKFNKEQILNLAREAVNAIGYTKKYQNRFGKECTICGDELEGVVHIGQQSGNIAAGVNKDAWGDQGIFFGYYCGETENGHGLDYQIAKTIGMSLYSKAIYNDHLPIGLDIKTQATIEVDEHGEYEVKEIIVAVPTVPGTEAAKVRRIVRNTIKELYPEASKAKLIINGTGQYYIHGPIGDSGTTGRKLVVDFYGSRSRIGGGSPWTKDGTKADLTLNIFAHACAKEFYKDIQKTTGRCHHAEVQLSCCIGRQEVLCVAQAFDHLGVIIASTSNTEKIPPSHLIKTFQLDRPIYRELCKQGLFTQIYKEELN